VGRLDAERTGIARHGPRLRSGLTMEETESIRHCEPRNPFGSNRPRLLQGLSMEETGSVKSSPTLLSHRGRIPSGCATMSGSFLTGPPREAEQGGQGGCLRPSPSAKGGSRGIFFDQFELFLRSPRPCPQKGSRARNDIETKSVNLPRCATTRPGRPSSPARRRAGPFPFPPGRFRPFPARSRSRPR